jgi:hypothetical protein
MTMKRTGFHQSAAQLPKSGITPAPLIERQIHACCAIYPARAAHAIRIAREKRAENFRTQSSRGLAASSTCL